MSELQLDVVPFTDRRLVDRGPGAVELRFDRRGLRTIGDLSLRGIFLQTDESNKPDLAPEHHIDIIRTGEGPAITSQFMQARYQYVKEQGWLDLASDDTDRYDTDPHTRTFIKHGEAGSNGFECGMRLTNVSSLSESLTWEMLSTNPVVAEQVVREHLGTLTELDSLAQTGRLWDLTRLVPDMSGATGPLQIMTAMNELFGSALAETAYRTGQRPVWIFLVTDTFKKIMSNNGISHETLFSGMLHDKDSQPSHLCYTDALDGYHRLRDSDRPRFQRTYADMARGLTETIDD